MENQQDQLPLECYLQLKQSQKLISEKLFKSKSKYFQDFPEIYYQLTSINILIPLINLDLDNLEASTLETLIQKITQDPHRSWVTFLWIVPEGYQESFEAYLDFIAPDLGNSSPKDYQMQVLDLPTLQHYWSTIDTRIDAYWHISTLIDQEFVCWNPEDQYANYFVNLPKILWSDDRPVTACLYESLLQKIEQLDIEAKKAFDRSNWGEAIDLYETIVSLNPLNPNNWANLGSSYLKQGNYQEAKECVEQAIVLNSSRHQYWNTLGLTYEQLQQIQDALIAYQNAIQIAPEDVDGYCNLGDLLVRLSQYELAEQVYQDALRISSWHSTLYVNLGNLLILMGQNAEAIRAYEKADALDPNNSELSLKLAIAYKDNPVITQYYYAKYLSQESKHQDALPIYENIIQTNSKAPNIYELESHVGYLSCLKALGYDELIFESVQKSINNLINQKDISEIDLLLIRRLLNYLNGKGDYQKAQDLAMHTNLFSVPTFNDLFVLLNPPIVYYSYSEILVYREKFLTTLEKIKQIDFTNLKVLEEGYALAKALLYFYVAYQNFNDLDIQKKISKLIHTILCQMKKSLITAKRVNFNDKKENKKIKIGYISNHFVFHSATHGILGWFKNHNRDRFEYCLYHVGFSLDTRTQEFASTSDHFHHIPLQDFPGLDQWLDCIITRLQDDDLDILVFTDVGMDIKSTLLARLRFAPIQCALWGHPLTTGSETIDYFLTASAMEPHDAHEHYSEQLVHLPNLSWSYPNIVLPERKLRSDFDLPDDRILYFSCQSLFKYLPQHDYIYPAIVQRVPQAFFIFLSVLDVTPIFWQRLQKAFAAVNLDIEDFCKILPRQSHTNFLALQGLSDVYLDTLTWSGGNTTLQALAWPIPVVTCPNQFMRGRHSYGILQTLGVTETIAHNEAEYIDIACELGLNPQWRSSVVEKIKSRNHRLYNDLQCVQAVETFFEYAYEKYQDDMIQQS